MIPSALSNRIFSRVAIRPASGRTSPAMQSSRVVFPAPEGPNRIVIPGGSDQGEIKFEIFSQPLANLHRRCVQFCSRLGDSGVV